MRTYFGFGSVTVMLSLAVAACGGSGDSGSSSTSTTSGSGGTGGGTGGTGGGPSHAAVTVSPASTTVLTCTQQTFTATVTGVSDTSVTWSATPGSVDDKGVYAAPNQVPDPASATVTATSKADPTAAGAATVTLATALPGKPLSLDADAADVGVYQHQIASRGDRVYAAWATSDNLVKVERSDDGGKTWGAAVNAAPTGLDVPANCLALTVDAANADLVYLVYRLPTTAVFASYDNGNTGKVMAFGLSTDGGQTWTTKPLIVGDLGGGICPDISSPVKDAVVIEAPGFYAGDSNPDMYLFSDAARGAGFATGTNPDSFLYIAHGETQSLATTARDLGLGVGQDGSSIDITESPRLFADGKGKLCLTWVGYGDSDPPTDGVYVQCSSDLGKTFTTPHELSAPATSSPHLPAGAFASNGDAVVVWFAEDDPAGGLLFARSTDGGQTFAAATGIPTYHAVKGDTLEPQDSDVAFDDAGALWIAYQIDDGGDHLRIAVDKSCDEGTTWSGAVLANGPEGATVDAAFPGLVMTTGAASLQTFAGGASSYELPQLTRLVP